ncbi:single-stranded DNA-binding protein [Cellulomonas fimi]|uniref:Single-stranded DNA-binding protein n=1 Tax=Cellulomonas fimi (strain ATCC 484 / DSM 20113 / JCM 1341 / CCUG 24087 / LMG 16345 / NBRC 15513 / NCIMB 8980 / NCTC 7547 / NRS-133) TaxID=590998 RepID=F4H5R8_CELFA|nr:single-stranded DNA-binding protein [Cellulomonas fimi]AEE45518.1 single-strand binding protein [Cellulomonas fimi ATCC 484]NNH09171.1 single-stranded DNA-binding protein [Cellulomonas fimi]VEH29698.1 Helix-destabilizing protein [Cellulomonas fimi]
MSTHSLDLTLVGWVGSDVRHFNAPGTTPYTSFRMASTRRWFDRREGAWRDGRTEWFTVKIWRSGALNVAQSLRKGEPVVVHGRLSTEEWQADDGARTSLVVEATAVGHDLTFGTTRFARTVTTAADGAGTGDVDGRPPVDVSTLPEVDDADMVPGEHVVDEAGRPVDDVDRALAAAGAA